MNNKTTEKVIIIGGGVAGLAAALYTSRANLNPLVFAGSPPGGQLTLTTEVENFPGFESILGPELIEKLRAQVKHFGTRIMDQNIVKVDFNKKPFTVFTANTDGSFEPYTAETIIIATGAKALWLGLDSEQRLRGKGVSACATCDGFFFRNKDVAVVGGGDTAMEEALTLTRFAKKVYVIHRRDFFKASKIMQERVQQHPKIEIIWNTAIQEVLGETKVTGLRLQSQDGKTKELPVDGLFLAIGHKPDTDILKESIDLDKKGYILTFNRLAEEILRGVVSVDNTRVAAIQKEAQHFSTATSREGIFAAGDCVDYIYRQASTAAGMGVSAALDVEKYLELHKM